MSCFSCSDFPFFIHEPAVNVLEEAWGAVVVLCARSDTVIEWNHANEDGFSVHTATGAECGGTGQFLMTSILAAPSAGETEFVASVKSGDCGENATFVSNTATCSCPASAFGTHMNFNLQVLYSREVRVHVAS